MTERQREIEDLVYSLFRGLDEKRDDEVGALFADDGIWHRQGVALHGPAQIASALARREAERRSVHIVTNLQVRQKDVGAWTARYYLTGWLAHGDVPFKASAILDCTDEIELRAERPRIVRKSSRKLGDLA